MKPETAKALKWPWPVKHSISNPIYYDHSSGIPVGVNFPSVTEMLERMPGGTLIRRNAPNSRGRNDHAEYTVSFYRHVWDCIKREWDKKLSHVIKHDSLDEALALLCIWFRDNNLMKWE